MKKISKVHGTLGVLSPMKGDPGGMGTIRLAGGTIRLALTDAKSLCLLLILKKIYFFVYHIGLLDQ